MLFRMLRCPAWKGSKVPPKIITASAEMDIVSRELSGVITGTDSIPKKMS
jgi:hypothetical protein